MKETLRPALSLHDFVLTSGYSSISSLPFPLPPFAYLRSAPLLDEVTLPCSLFGLRKSIQRDNELQIITMISFRGTELAAWIGHSAVAASRNYPCAARAVLVASCGETLSKKGAGRMFEYFWWSKH